MRRQDVHAVSVPPTASEQRADELACFVQQHSQRLIGALTLITGNRATAEDALQDALVKAWHRRDQPIDQLTAWITVVATNQARSGWRRKQAEQRAMDKIGGRANHGAAPASEPDNELLEALRSLPERERQVAVMHYVLDQSVAQVAAALGIADGTVKTQLFRAREHLAARLTLNADRTNDQQGGAA